MANPFAAPFIFNYDASLSGQQKQWIQDAIARCRFPMYRGTAQMVFKVVPEPTCPGHADYMCTHGVVGGVWTIEIRQGADDPESPILDLLPNPAKDVKAFFQEGIIHEVVGHVFWFEHFSNDVFRTQVASFFERRTTTGSGTVSGTLADWNPPDADWADRIQEALAEFTKDVYLPPDARVFDNRTNWVFKESMFSQWIDLIEDITCIAAGGGDS